MHIVLPCFTDMQILYIQYDALRIDEDPFS